MLANTTTLNAFFDYGVGALIIVLSTVVSIIAFVSVVICEALTLYSLGYGSLKRSFAVSLVINLVSTILGYAVTIIQYQLPYHYIPLLLNTSDTKILEVLILFGAFWAFSIVSGGGYYCYWIKQSPLELFGVRCLLPIPLAIWF